MDGSPIRRWQPHRAWGRGSRRRGGQSSRSPSRGRLWGSHDRPGVGHRKCRDRPKRVTEAKRRLEQELCAEARANAAYERYWAHGPNVRRIELLDRGGPSPTDASGERHWGHIDTFVVTAGTYELTDDWGPRAVMSDAPYVRTASSLLLEARAGAAPRRKRQSRLDLIRATERLRPRTPISVRQTELFVRLGNRSGLVADCPVEAAFASVVPVL